MSADDIGTMPLPTDGPDYWADLQQWSLAALRKTQEQAAEIERLRAVLRDMATEDFRGPEPWYRTAARRALGDDAT